MGTVDVLRTSYSQILKYLPRLKALDMYHYFGNEHEICTSDLNKSFKVIDLILDHDLDASNEELWSLKPWQLKALIDQGISISSLSVNCLDINEENVTEFIMLMSCLKKCEVKVTNLDNERYTFTVKDFELIVKEDVRITEIYISDALRINEIAQIWLSLFLFSSS